MAQTILEAIRKIKLWVEAAVKDALFWIWNQLLTLMSSLLSSLSLPDLNDIFDLEGLADFAPLIAAADRWVPVQYGLTLLAAYLTLWVAVIPLRFVLGHLPGIGGRGN